MSIGHFKIFTGNWKPWETNKRRLRILAALHITKKAKVLPSRHSAATSKTVGRFVVDQHPGFLNATIKKAAPVFKRFTAMRLFAFVLLSLIFVSPSRAMVCENTDGTSPNAGNGGSGCTCGESTCATNDYCLASATTAIGRCSYFPRCRSFHRNNLQECVKCDPENDFKCLVCKKGNMLDTSGVCQPAKQVFTTKMVLEEEDFPSNDGRGTSYPFYHLDLEKHILVPDAMTNPFHYLDSSSNPVPMTIRAGHPGIGFVAGVFSSMGISIDDIVAWGHPLFGGHIPGAMNSETDNQIRAVHPLSIYENDGTIVGRDTFQPGDGRVFQARPKLNEYKQQSCSINDVVATTFAYAALIDCFGTSRYSVVVPWGDKDYGGLLNNRVKRIMYSQGGLAHYLPADTAEYEHFYYQVKALYSTCCAFAAVLNDLSVLAWGHSDRGGSIPLATVNEMKAAGGATSIHSNNRAFVAVTRYQNTNDANGNDQLIPWGSTTYGGSLPTVLKNFFSTNQALNPRYYNANIGIVSVHHTAKAFIAVVKVHKMAAMDKLNGNNELVVFWGSENHGGKFHTEPIDGESSTIFDEYIIQDIKKKVEFDNPTDDTEGSNFFTFEGGKKVQKVSGVAHHALQFYKKVRQITTTHSMVAVTLIDGTVFSFGGKPRTTNSVPAVPHSFVPKGLAKYMFTKGVRSVFGADQSFTALLEDGSVVTWGRTGDYMNIECAVSCTCSSPFGGGECGSTNVDLSTDIGSLKVISLFSTRDTWSALSLVPTSGNDKKNVAMFGIKDDPLNPLFYTDQTGTKKFVLNKNAVHTSSQTNAAERISSGGGAKMLYSSRSSFVAVLHSPTGSNPVVGWGLVPCDRTETDSSGGFCSGGTCCSEYPQSGQQQTTKYQSGLITFTDGSQTNSPYGQPPSDQNPWTNKIPQNVFSAGGEYVFSYSFGGSTTIMYPGMQNDPGTSGCCSPPPSGQPQSYTRPSKFMFQCYVEAGVTGRSCTTTDGNWVGSAYTGGTYNNAKVEALNIDYKPPPTLNGNVQFPSINGPPRSNNGGMSYDETTWAAPCRLGYAPSFSTQRCTECEKGKVGPRASEIRTALNSMQDPMCPPCDGKTTRGKNSLSCIVCGDGVGTTTLKPQCHTCGAGKFARWCNVIQEVGGGVTYEPPQISIASAVTNVENFVRCTSTQDPRPVCLSCPANHYLGFDETSSQDKHDSLDDCIACPNGQLTGKLSGQILRTGANYCGVCGAGRFTRNGTLATRECIECPVGWWQDSSAEVSCKRCVVGQYQNLNGSAFCFKCSRGKHQPLEGQVACTPCAANHFARAEEASGCVSCTAGRATPSGSNACSNCGAGTKKVTFPVGATDPDDFKCVDCLKGTFTDLQGLTACKDCPEGYTQNVDGQGGCFPCSKGEYQDEEGTTSCKNCAVNFFTNETTQIACKACSPGKGAENVGSSRCEDCPAGKAGMSFVVCVVVCC